MPESRTSRSSKNQLEVHLDKEKDTKNTVRFDSDDPRLRTVYLSKEAHTALGSPESIVVQVREA